MRYSRIKSFRKGCRSQTFVLAYLLLAGASVVSGGFYEDALWGAFGWNMGFLTQVSFVLLYLYLSRFGKYYRVMLWALCLAATVVFGIGILHRLMIDPVGFYDGLTNDQKAQFLSTLGQGFSGGDTARGHGDFSLYCADKAACDRRYLYADWLLHAGNTEQ